MIEKDDTVILDDDEAARYRADWRAFGPMDDKLADRANAEGRAFHVKDQSGTILNSHIPAEWWQACRDSDLP